jgi:hypothetical protein
MCYTGWVLLIQHVTTMRERENACLAATARLGSKCCKTSQIRDVNQGMGINGSNGYVKC